MARILVVDDQPPIRAFVRAALRDDYEIEEAEDGTRALDVLSRDRAFDLLVVDVRMPKLGGRALVKELEARNLNPKILFLTGHADDLFPSGEPLGPNRAFLEKPVTVGGLREAVSLLLFGTTRPSGR